MHLPVKRLHGLLHQARGIEIPHHQAAWDLASHLWDQPHPLAVHKVSAVTVVVQQHKQAGHSVQAPWARSDTISLRKNIVFICSSLFSAYNFSSLFCYFSVVCFYLWLFFLFLFIIFIMFCSVYKAPSSLAESFVTRFWFPFITRQIIPL
jgi:hypothetical protein